MARAKYDPAFAKSEGFTETGPMDTKSHSLAQDERVMARRNAKRMKARRKKT